MIYFFLTLFLFSGVAHSESLPPDSDIIFSNQLALADQAYQRGDCVRSINDYREIYLHSRVRDHKFLAVYRMSYCYLNLGQPNSAVLGFGTLLKVDPQNQDVRLKYAQALLAIGKYELAIDHANHIQEQTFFIDKSMVVLQALVQSGQPLKAIEFTEQIQVPRDWRPVFEYWKGVAWFNHGDLIEARLAFIGARDISPTDLWVRSAAQEWIDIIAREMRVVRGSASFGYFIDSNIGQQTTVRLNTSYDPISIAPNSSTYTDDTAFWGSFSLSFLMYNARLLQIISGIDASSPFYQNNREYNNQNYSLYLGFLLKPSTKVTMGATARATDSRYNHVYYQDTVSFTPEINIYPYSGMALHGEIGFSQQITTKFARSVSPSGSGSVRLSDWITLLAGFSFTRARGETASYNTNTGVPVLVSGSSFSRYTSRGGYLGLSFALPLELNLTTQYSRFWTNYEYENLTYGTGRSLGTSRKDKMITYYGELSRAVFSPNFVLAGSITYTENRSDGAQGYPVNYYISNYNYDRLVTKFSATFYF